MSVDLFRFAEPHAADFERALGEIEGGRKQTHWIWYVFPQITELGRSATARHYGIGSVEEARAFLADPVLGSNYRRIVRAVREQVLEHGVSVHQLLGSPDDMKLVSSLTLFAAVVDRATDEALARDIEALLDAANGQGLSRCTVTQSFLDASAIA